MFEVVAREGGTPGIDRVPRVSFAARLNCDTSRRDMSSAPWMPTLSVTAIIRSGTLAPYSRREECDAQLTKSGEKYLPWRDCLRNARTRLRERSGHCAADLQI